jgi:hypothetical protein
MNNAEELLPSVHPVLTQAGTICNVIAFNFVPQLLKLLQNRRIMIQDNLVLDMLNPLQQCKSHYGKISELSPDQYTEKLISSTSNTQNRNCLFPLFSGSIALCNRE